MPEETATSPKPPPARRTAASGTEKPSVKTNGADNASSALKNGAAPSASTLSAAVRAYNPAADAPALERAHTFARTAHEGQKRASGAPYFSHPVAVAQLLCEKRLDTASIITALLHDTVEDTDTALSDIETRFGAEVAGLVDGVTKLTQLEHLPGDRKRAANFRKLVMAMSRDIRVLLVKLADRLHNMRTIGFVTKAESRRRIAAETMDIYTPLAERLGIRDWKEELEDLAFAELYRDARSSIVRRLAFLHAQDQVSIDRMIGALSDLMARHGLKAEVTGREKTPLSIWRKMENRQVAFSQLHDIMAFRVVVETEEDCYTALGAAHAAWKAVPGRFKDYISVPKPNGYRSIHTCVIGPENRIMEVQIRTAAMHEVAELGVAAHWRYKESGGSDKPARAQYPWLSHMLDILSNAEDSGEFLENTRMDLYPDQVFVFTPKGDIHALPRGSTPVDLAYAVHSDIGNHCTGARINGAIAPLRTRLRNGDQVEIITASHQTPSPSWEDFVRTGRAKTSIRRFRRSLERAQYATLGKEVVTRAFRQAGLSITDRALRGALDRFRCATVDDLHVRVAQGHITGRDVLLALHPEQPPPKPSSPVAPRPSRAATSALPLRGLARDMAVHYARCCHPLPGDRIIGIITTGKGVTVHVTGCRTLENFDGMPERWIDLSWDPDESRESVFTGRLHAVIANRPGSLAAVTGAISRDGGNITNLAFANRSHDFFNLVVDVDVRSVRHLHSIASALRAAACVHAVERQLA